MLTNWPDEQTSCTTALVCALSVSLMQTPCAAVSGSFSVMLTLNDPLASPAQAAGADSAASSAPALASLRLPCRRVILGGSVGDRERALLVRRTCVGAGRGGALAELPLCDGTGHRDCLVDAVARAGG